MKGIARYFVATAAGAGLGACAALAQRHLVGPRSVADDAPAVAAPEVPRPFADATPVAPAEVASPPPPPVDVADLDAARIRLRERAAALRAEMEGRAGVP